MRFRRSLTICASLSLLPIALSACGNDGGNSEEGGSDVGNETVTLINISNRAVDLKGWEIVDTNGNGFELIINKLDAGEVESITLSGAARTAQLGNKGGDIILKDGSGEVMDEVFYTGKQAKQGITILF